MGQTLLPSEAWLYLCSQAPRAARELAIQFPSATGVTQKLTMFRPESAINGAETP